MSELPFVEREATIRLFGVDLTVVHLNTGQRIITADSMAALFEAMGEPSVPSDPAEILAAVKALFG